MNSTNKDSPVRHIEWMNKENRPDNQNSSYKRSIKKPYKCPNISLRAKLGFEKQSESPCKRFRDQQYYSSLIDNLPKEVFYRVSLFLTPFECQTKVKPLSQYFKTMVQSTSFWNHYNRYCKLNLIDKYMRSSNIVERRSKGKLFQAVSLLDGQLYTQRIVDVMVANANCDDGLPPSLAREISYLRSLQMHENINKLVEVEAFKNTLVCLVFEYQPHNLKDFIKSKLISPKQAKDILRQIAAGMNSLHTQGLMHRNIKPENILLTKDHQVKICDFNLSRLVQGPVTPLTPEDPKDRERSGRESKRLWYRAPEMLLRKSQYAHEIDVWSFGCLMAEVILREPLLNGDSEIAQLFQTFQLLGAPTNEDWPFIAQEVVIKFPQWKQYPLNFSQIKDMEAYKKEFMANRSAAYQKIKILNAALGEDGMDLLDSIFRIRPSERITFAQIVKHPWMLKQKWCETPPSIAPIPKLSLYMAKSQPNLTPMMRAILVDWLIDVGTHFDLSSETLHLAVTYTDLTLQQKTIEKNSLQLVGVTSMKMADVYNERSREYYKQENCQEYSYITADEYTAQQLIMMEKEILKCLDYKLTYTTIPHLLNQYNSQLKTSEQIQKCSEFFGDLFLQNYEILRFQLQLLAISYIFIASIVIPETDSVFEGKIQLDITERDLIQCVTELRYLHIKWKDDPQTNGFDAVHQKHKNLSTRSYNIQFKENQVIKFYQAVIQY